MRLVVAVATPRDVRAARVQLDPVGVRLQQRERVERVLERLVGDADERGSRGGSASRERRRGPCRAGVRQAPSRSSSRPAPGSARSEVSGSRPAGARDRAARRRSRTPSRRARRGARRSCRTRRPGRSGCGAGARRRSWQRGIVDGVPDARPRERQPEHGAGEPMGGSGGRAKNSGRPTAEYQPIDRLCYRADGGRSGTTSCAGWSRRRSSTATSSCRAGSARTVYFDKFRFLTRPDLLRELAARGHGAPAAGHRPPRGARGRGDVAGRGRLAGDRAARRRGPQGAEGLRDPRAGRGPRARRRQRPCSWRTSARPGTRCWPPPRSCGPRASTCTRIVLAIDRGGADHLREAGYDVAAVAVLRPAE